MTTSLDVPTVRPSTSPSHRLRTTMAAVRILLSWLGVRKTLTPEQKAQAADTFGAEGPESVLIEVGSDHRLADPEPLEEMLRACLEACIVVLIPGTYKRPTCAVENRHVKSSIGRINAIAS